MGMIAKNSKSGHKEFKVGKSHDPASEGGYYWYSPDAKYFVKRQYNKASIEG
jgi:hypothetical protein